MMEIDQLQQMKAPELRAYIRKNFGYEFKGNAAKVDMINYILDEQKKPKVEKAPVKAEESKEDTGVSPSGLKPGYAKVVIQRDPRAKKNLPAFVGTRRGGNYIPRGKEIEIPADVWHNLNDAIQTQSNWDESGNQLPDIDVHSYPFQTIEKNF